MSILHRTKTASVILDMSYSPAATAIVISLVSLAINGRLGDANAERSDVVHSESLATLVVRADTVFFEVIAGEVLIFALPDSLSEEKVDSWRVVKAPAYSRIANRSFLWKTRKEDRGLHQLHFEGTSSIQVDEFVVDRMEMWSANVRVR